MSADQRESRAEPAAWRVEISEKPDAFDALGERVHKDVLDLGFKNIQRVGVVQVYTILGAVSQTEIEKISRELLADPVTQDYRFFPNQKAPSVSNEKVKIVEIAYLPGVMDPVEESTLKGIRDLGVTEVKAVRTARQYHLHGNVSKQQCGLLVDKVLYNKLIQRVIEQGQSLSRELPAKKTSSFTVQMIDLLGANERDLQKISQKGQLFLNEDEMKAIQKHYRGLKRNPSDCELETIAQTWSEHCYHKTFRGKIDFEYREQGKVKRQRINNLLKSTIIKATQELNKPWCVSVFHDNAGIIEFDEEWNVCFKVETHNHPSALEPFGGANTGIGGVIRDILGTGLGARPVCNTDVFCFASPDYPEDQLPAGTLHPKRVMKGVVSGVRDYGNKMGIPTINGAILFDKDYVGNPLVYCGTVGIIPKGKEHKKVNPGDLVVVVGGKTGRDGIHGATFSSGELTEDSEVISSGAVQIGNPIEEKKVADVLLQGRDRELFTAVTDCGAGGLSSAVGEMGKDLGARVDLEKVPLKYEGLSYTEVWISESQERMVLSVSPVKVDELLALFASENVEATAIGTFTDSKRLELFFNGCQVCDVDMEFLHDGIPQITKKAVWTPAKIREKNHPCPKNLTEKLEDVLSHYNVCSKEWVIRQYDHEVQGGSVIKPLVGLRSDGPSDASVILPILGTKRGIAVSNGINPRFGKIDPFWMAASCIDEAVRQIIAVGGSIDRIAILDNFCWGNPDKPDRLGSLVRAAQGCYRTAVDYGTPFISGKDSLYNEYTQGAKSIAIPGTLLISAIGIIENVLHCVSMDLKEEGNLVYVVGATHDELGGSIYLDTYGSLGKNVPQVNARMAIKTFQALSLAVKNGLVASIHDCSEGGIAAALAEMAFSGGRGITARADQIPYTGKVKRDDIVLFSESNSRFLVEVTKSYQQKFETLLAGVPFAAFGRVEKSPEFIVYGLQQEVCIAADIQDLKEQWKRPLAF